MTVTRQFVFINFPKTGSSFVRKVLAETFRLKSSRRSPLNRISKSLAKRLPDTGPWGGLRALCEYSSLQTARYLVLDHYNPVRGYYDQHGKVYQAPRQLRHRRFLSVARDPLSRFYSYYNFFKAVKEDRFLPPLREVIKSSGKPLSEMSAETFYDLLFWKHNCIWMASADLQEKIGPQTLGFVNHFAIDPVAAFGRLRHGANFDDLRDLFPENFVLLTNNRLASQLRAELEQAGVPTVAAGDPVWTERVLPDGVGGNFTHQSARGLLSASLAERIERDEWFLYDAYEKLAAAGSVPEQHRQEVELVDKAA